MKKKLLLIILIASCGISKAQPTAFGCKIADNNYTTYDLLQRGLVKTVRIQGGTVSVVPIFEFMQGTAAAPDYSINWRPYTSGQTLASYNLMIDPVAQSASARYNTAFGGASGNLPAITSGDYYTVNVGRLANQSDTMSILETVYNPKTITISQSPVASNVAANQPVTVSVTLSAPLSPGEKVFIRWTNSSDYTTATITEITNFAGTTNGSTVIPGQPQGTFVSYYVLSTNQTSLVNVSVDYYTLNVDNNNNTAWNYSYTVNGPLPLGFTSLNAHVSGNGIQLQWNVEQQVNIDHYEVERSANGLNFNMQNIVTANTLSSSSYNYFDASPLKGVNYYRIRSIDKNGVSSLSQIVKITQYSGRHLSFYPNPFKGEKLNINMNNYPVGNYTLKMTTATGQLLFSHSINYSGGTASQSLDLGKRLPEGNYVIQLLGDGVKDSQIVTVQ